MPITPPDSPRINTGGASNTECTVIIYTHDRGPERASTKIDISKYITSVGVSHHLSGGGSADIALPAVDFIEDLFAAGDVVNIYFKANRGDLDLYNRGRVRVFFGYVESVTKSVTVSGSGSKATTYSISCKDFSKAIRATEIYHNPHLSHQTEEMKKGVVRHDVRANLGGISLLSKGIAIQGTPREIILQNLMRLLGFGAQWALPASYREVLPDSSTNMHLVKNKNKESLANTLQGAKDAILKSEDQDLRLEFVQLLEELAKESIKTGNPVSRLWQTYVADPYTEGLSAKVTALVNKYLYTSFEFRPAKNPKAGKFPFINNTFFKLKGITNSKVATGMGTSTPDLEVTSIEQGLKKDLEKVSQSVIEEIEGFENNVINTFGVFPKANQLAQGFSEKIAENYKTDVITIFNILCLDYLEPVGGFWPSADNIFYQGSLYDSLERGSNPAMNEFFFDLRPSPLFFPEKVDGAGVPLDGAIPMVPAVVLRQKPFTNYPRPSKALTNSDINESLVVGGMGESTGKPGVVSDQLLLHSGGAFGDFGFKPVTGSPEEVNKVSGKLKQVTDVSPTLGTLSGSELLTDSLKDPYNPLRYLSLPGISISALFLGPALPVNSEDSDAPPEDSEEPSPEDAYNKKLEELSASIDKDNITNKNIMAMYGQSLISFLGATTSPEAATELILLNKKKASLAVSKQGFASVVTLPRPVFRSPDNNRITKELDTAYAQYLLGVQNVRNGLVTNKFSAFATKDSNLGVNAKGITGSNSFVDASGKEVESEKDTLSLLSEGSGMYDIHKKLAGSGRGKDVEDKTYHVLDYCTIRDIDCRSENYSRGDFAVKNFVEFWGAVPGDKDAQRLFLGTTMPMITPISVYRFGIRIQENSTEHVQALMGGESSLNRQKDTLLSWVVLQDMWVQHNHEYLNGRMSTRGFPGIRPGYRVDRPELNLSFYVESVQHSWSHPGILLTNLSVSRGQPSGEENALKYYTPQPKKDPATANRQELGKVFTTSEFTVGGKTKKLNVPGTYTGSADVGGQIPPTTRKEFPPVQKEKESK